MKPCNLAEVLADERWRLILVALRSSNDAFRSLYRAGFWLRSHEAASIARSGLTSLRCYRLLAEKSMACGEPRFPLHSKYHMLYHTWRFLEKGSERLDWIESPLSDNCQMDEGFIGVLSRISRRVSPSATIERTLDVYLTALADQWRHKG